MFLLTDGYTTTKMLLKWKKGFDQSKVRKKLFRVISKFCEIFINFSINVQLC